MKKKEYKEELLESGLDKFFKNMQKENLLKIVILPIISFVILDIWSTYQGVCVYGGIELNRVAIVMAYALGFVGTNVLYMMAYISLGFLFCWRLLKEHNVYFKMFLMGLFAVYVIQHLMVVVANYSTLLYQMTGTPPIIMNMPASVELVTTFERERFCRLFPWS